MVARLGLGELVVVAMETRLALALPELQTEAVAVAGLAVERITAVLVVQAS